MKAIQDIDAAIIIYYTKTEIGNKEIRDLFGEVGNQTCMKYKRLAKAVMAERGVKTFSPYAVDTEAAYEAWGIDIAKLERNRARLMKLGLTAKSLGTEHLRGE